MNSKVIPLFGYLQRADRLRETECLDKIAHLLDLCQQECAGLASQKKRDDISQGLLFVRQMVELAVESEPASIPPKETIKSQRPGEDHRERALLN